MSRLTPTLEAELPVVSEMELARPLRGRRPHTELGVSGVGGGVGHLVFLLPVIHHMLHFWRGEE